MSEEKQLELTERIAKTNRLLANEVDSFIDSLRSKLSELEKENKRLRESRPLPDNYQRLLDLVRYSRSELHRENLIDDDEYAQLCVIEGSPGRLCAYDDIRRQLEAVRLAKDTLRANLKDAVEALEKILPFAEGYKTRFPNPMSDGEQITLSLHSKINKAKETLQRLKEGA